MVNLALSLLLAGVLREVVDMHLLVGWLLLLNGVGSARLALRNGYLRAGQAVLPALWEERFRGMLIATALLWGCGSLLLVRGRSEERRVGKECRL